MNISETTQSLIFHDLEPESAVKESMEESQEKSAVAVEDIKNASYSHLGAFLWPRITGTTQASGVLEEQFKNVLGPSLAPNSSFGKLYFLEI